MRKAYRLIQSCRQYIFFSTDPTALYFSEGLDRIRTIAPILLNTDGNMSFNGADFMKAHQLHVRIDSVLTWLQENHRLPQAILRMNFDDCIKPEMESSEFGPSCTGNPSRQTR
jgi:hypothetical protein